jgi:hypothetical protein
MIDCVFGMTRSIAPRELAANAPARLSAACMAFYSTPIVS